MKRISLLMILCLLIFTFCTGCGRNSSRVVDLTSLKNEVGEYQFPDLAWGSSREQVENVIGCTFETMSKSEEREMILADISVECMDVEGHLFCEFGQTGLDEVRINFKPAAEQQEEVWNEMVEMLIKTYGAVEPLVPPMEPEKVVYFWETTVTRRTALTIRESNGTISLEVYIIPAEKSQ